MHAQRLVDDAGERLVDDAGERGSPALGSVALLGHVPECAADTHCRSACKMVCEEALSGTRAVRNHAATLISFGCCLSTPLIEKQVLGPSAAREVQLSEVPARGRKAETRLGYNPLADQHSLAANLRALEQDEGHQVHRLSHLRHAFQHDEEASRRRVGFLGLGAALPRGRAMRGTIMLKKEEEGPFTIERYKFNPWAREEVAENKSITDTDPNGVEHESEQGV
ncbi:hypothetical protein T484DRAFT_1853971 [Baffinella frigidus]|nr:hypothetical protein T484DRAFT_1853971 [Cryptophyta sp. CCMP2293]